MRYTFNDYEFDVSARHLRRHGKEVALEPKAFDLLRYLIERRRSRLAALLQVPRIDLGAGSDATQHPGAEDRANRAPKTKRRPHP